MTAGRVAKLKLSAMAFMMKKKKYKFQVEMTLDELVEVPFVSAVLFAKIRLLDGGNFQDYSTREEVRDHKVQWDARFEFACKMTANVSTGILESCNLRVSVRKEIKGGRSYLKHGFCDINLAEFAGSRQVSRRYLLEGYDSRHRSDNSMLKVTLSLSLLSGDILFKVPSPTTKTPTSVGGTTAEVEAVTLQDERTSEEFSGGSLAGSVASGSSGFGSLPKKRPALFNSELLSSTNSTLSFSEVTELPSSGANENDELNQSTNQCTTNVQLAAHNIDMTSENLGHSRHSSTTSQISRISGYCTQHSRQSSSGDSVGHNRSPSWPIWGPANLTSPFSLPSPSVTLMDSNRNKFWALEYSKLKSLKLNTYSLDDNEIFNLSKQQSQPYNDLNLTIKNKSIIDDKKCVFLKNNITTSSGTATATATASSIDNKTLKDINVSFDVDRQDSNISSSSNDIYLTPDCTLVTSAKQHEYLQKNSCDDCELEQFKNYIEKSRSCSAMGNHNTLNMADNLLLKNKQMKSTILNYSPNDVQSLGTNNININNFYQTDNINNQLHQQNTITYDKNNFVQNILIPFIKRTKINNDAAVPTVNNLDTVLFSHSTPNRCTSSLESNYIVVDNKTSKPTQFQSYLDPCNSSVQRTISLGSLRPHSSSPVAAVKRSVISQGSDRSLSHSHRKLYEGGGNEGGKLSPVPSNAAISPLDEISPLSLDITMSQQRHLTSGGATSNIYRNSSAGSLALSETGSLDRAKSALERRKRAQEIIDLGTITSGGSQVSGHVEVTRVNPENLIAEIIESTNLEQEDETAETSGLQLFIAKDGTAALGNHEVKSQISSGVQSFKQVVIEEKR